MSDLVANVAIPKTGELLTIRITEDNLSELARRFSHTLFTRTEGKTAILWCGIYGYPGETIVFSEAGGIIGIYDDEDIQNLFEFTGEKRSVRRPWPTAPLIIIHKGQDLGSGERVAPGTVALRDSEGNYFTRNYGFLCKHIDRIDNWVSVNPGEAAS